MHCMFDTHTFCVSVDYGLVLIVLTAIHGKSKKLIKNKKLHFLFWFKGSVDYKI